MIKKLTSWQTVIYRNFGSVPVQNIAKVLAADEKTVLLEAQRMGIDCIEFESAWLKKGFVSIIRNNFDLLTHGQIQTLLGVTEKEYWKLMEEYDFLNIKLGAKPDVCPPFYQPLTEKQKADTRAVRAFTNKNFIIPKAKRFDFFAEKIPSAFIASKKYAIEERFTSVYNADFGGGLLDDELSDFSEEYLKRLSGTGVNGVWLQETLRNIAPFSLDKEYESEEYQKRIGNLKRLTERCERFGVNVYLYLNEPRSLPTAFFEEHANLKGDKTEDGYCLCTSNPDVQNYLYEAIKFVAQNVPKLKGVMTITMSENNTHCYSRSPHKYGDANKTECESCAKRKPEEIAAEVNNIILKGLKDGNGNTKLIANMWGWGENMLWTEEQAFRGIDLLDKDVEILCISEYWKKFNRGGVDSNVVDYSISVVGPSEITVKMLDYAKKRGHKIWAKIQCNNSWELSAAPYIPVFNLMIEHVKRLKKLGVFGLMMGWSLGGYPGGALTICNMFCGETEPDETEWYQLTFGENACAVQKAVNCFSEAFQEYPFSLDGLYFGGQNLGCGNFWSLEKSGRESTMVCYTFDDYKNWTSPYGLDVYINQYVKMLEKWEDGLLLLKGLKGTETEELQRMAEVCKCHWGSAMRLAQFVKYKQGIAQNRKMLIECIDEEYAATKTLYGLYSQDATVGFEATNHYYYNANILLEKMLSLLEMKEALNG